MPTARRKLATMAPVLAGICLVAVAAATPSPSEIAAARSIAEVNSWVSKHAGSLPTTLEEVSLLPVEYRKSVVGKLSLSQQQELWRQQVKTFVTPDSELSPLQRRMVRALDKPLTDAQKAIVRQILDSLPRIFDSTLTLTQRQAVASIFCGRSKTFFTHAQGVAMFGLIGDRAQPPKADVKEASLIGSDVLNDIRTLLRKVHLKRPALGVCDCNEDSICDCNNGCTNMGGPAYGCLPPASPSSCGCFWVYKCNGNCLAS